MAPKRLRFKWQLFIIDVLKRFIIAPLKKTAIGNIEESLMVVNEEDNKRIQLAHLGCFADIKRIQRHCPIKDRAVVIATV